MPNRDVYRSLARPCFARSSGALGIVASVVVAALFGAGWTRNQSAIDEARAAQPIAIAGDMSATAPACRPRAVARFIAGFLGAFNRGDAKALQRAIAREGDFKWFTIFESGQPGVRIFSRRDAVPTLLRRQRIGERMRLAMAATGRDVGGRVGVSLVVRRTAPDLATGLGGRLRLADGKAGIACSARRVVFWSLGMDLVDETIDVPPNLIWPCPKPSGWTPSSGTIVSCATR